MKPLSPIQYSVVIPVYNSEGPEALADYLMNRRPETP